MAGKDFRLTAVLAVRDTAAPVIQAFSKKWTGLKKIVESTDFKSLKRQMALFSSSMKDVGDKAKELGEKLSGPLLAAASSVGFSLQQSISDFASTGDAFDKMAARCGLSSERLQEWSYAATRAGAAPEDLEDALKDFSEHVTEIANGLDTSSDAFTLFEKLGISVRDANGDVKKTEVLFREFSDALKRNEDPALRAKMAMAAMGESGRKILPALTEGAEGLDKMAAEARALGIIMSDEDTAAAAKLTDDLTNLRMVISSVGRTIGSILVPTVSAMAQRLQGIIVTNREAFSERFAGVAERFAEAFGKIDFERIVGGLLTFADYAIRAFNALGGFNTVLYGLGAIIAGKTLFALVSLGSSVITMVQTFGALATAAKAVGIAMAGAVGPIGLIIAAVAAAVTPSIIANWDKIWSVIEGVGKAVADGVKAVWGGLTDWVGSIFSAVSQISDRFMSADLPGVFEGFGQLFDAALSILPEKWLAAWEGLKKTAGDMLASIGEMIAELFGKIDFGSLVPDFAKSWLGLDAQKPAAQQVKQERVQMPSASVQGRLAVEVAAAQGTSARVTDVKSDRGLQIQGSVGASQRYTEGAFSW